jgi:hypothetical protein
MQTDPGARRVYTVVTGFLSSGVKVPTYLQVGESEDGVLLHFRVVVCKYYYCYRYCHEVLSHKASQALRPFLINIW